ncbi:MULTISPECIES: YdeI family protein [unclassified Flavobacterium]|uniref:YdeI/OmpD-associated family protein n=1 Tax=unclassified Flavobacterium TaxID=196869 RepID=UPI001F129E1C|nr:MULTISPECIES: YdeI/OmpD-associated family protein [unclassified Flavobacterium]UMY65774.1 YdeI/OmpD-associated family protein [Flavobacterium sp. HJ-32-4]
MDAVFFSSPSKFREWLVQHHETAAELLVGYYKVSTGKAGMTWSESVDEALCFGWIDGVRQTIDADRYQIRFTPRKPGSSWSNVNIKKVAALTEAGKMTPAGLAAFDSAKADKKGVYSYEKEKAAFPAPFEAVFRKHPEAWAYFENLAPSYRRTSIHWVMSAKQEATQRKRLEQLIAQSAAGTNPWKDNKYARKK